MPPPLNKPKLPVGVNVVTPVVVVGSSFWFWLYVEVDGSAGNCHSVLQVLLHTDCAAMAEPWAYQPVAWYGLVFGPP